MEENMRLTTEEIAGMFDLSCVQMYNTRDDVERLITVAEKYGFGHITALECFLPMMRERLENNNKVKLVGNVSFPSGADSTKLKMYQAEQLRPLCDEIDMVMNTCLLKSGEYNAVAEDVKGVRKVLDGIPMKVIIESPILTDEQIKAACEICVDAGSDFVKTGTGWGNATTVEQVRLIKSVVGDRALIKASGGIHTVSLLVDMYRAGARRFGVNMDKGISIIEQCNATGGSIEL
jgi:deoxyribose-phosphate aldolase